jgi:hypothetical protein
MHQSEEIPQSKNANQTESTPQSNFFALLQEFFIIDFHP